MPRVIGAVNCLDYILAEEVILAIRNRFASGKTLVKSLGESQPADTFRRW